MDNSIDKQTLKKQVEDLSWYELMTSQPIIDLYVEHIRESPIPYECKDDEKEIEGQVKDFNRILNKHGRAILKELFSDIRINQPLGDRTTEFALRFSQLYKRTGWLYWLQVIVSYISTLLMWYVIWDKDEKQSENRPPSQSNEGSLSSVLRQLKNNWTPSVAKAFAEVGVNSPQELTPIRLFALVEKNCYNDEKTGKRLVGLWSEENSLQRIESWTAEILQKILAQNDIILGK